MKEQFRRIIAYVIVLLTLFCANPLGAEQVLPDNAVQNETETQTRAEWIRSEMENLYARAEERFRL